MFEHFLRLPVLRTIVDDAPLPIGERLVEKTERCFGQPFRLRVVGRGDQAEERLLLLRREPAGVLLENGLQALESLVRGKRPQSWELLSCCVLSRRCLVVGRFLIGTRPLLPLQLVFEKRLPVRSLFDRFEPNRGCAGRHANLDRETAVAGEGRIAQRAGQFRPLQTVTRQAPFASDLGPHPRDLFSAAGIAPAFDEKNFAARFPLGWQIEAKLQIAVRDRALRFARAMEKLPKRLDRLPRGRALHFLEQTLTALQARRCFSASGLLLPRFAHGAFEARFQRRALGLQKANQGLDRVELLVRRLERGGQRWFASAVRGEELAQFDERRPKLIQLRVQIPKMIVFVRHKGKRWACFVRWPGAGGCDESGMRL